MHLALGLHPLAAHVHARELPEFLRLAPSVHLVGEIGLDSLQQATEPASSNLDHSGGLRSLSLAVRVLLLFTLAEPNWRLSKY